MKKESIFKLVLILVVFFLVYQFGVRPIFSSDYSFKDRKQNAWAKDKLPKLENTYDVIVLGSDPEGIAAAISAARIGANTLIITEDNNLGGYVSKDFYTDFYISKNSKGIGVNRGLVLEFMSRLGSDTSLDNYTKTMTDLVKDESRIEVVYNAKLEKTVIENRKLKSIAVNINGKTTTYNGSIFIDSTREGKLLESCGVPFYYGSGDLNLPQSFQPAKLNFEMEGVKWSDVKTVLSTKSKEFYEALGKYKTSDVNLRINDFNVYDEGNGKIVVKGLEAFGTDFSNSSRTQEIYNVAVKESKDLAEYLSKTFKVFKNAKFIKAAEAFLMPEYKHFKGHYTLTVNDVLTNKDFPDKIAIGAAPVYGGKLADKSPEYIIGKPDQYGIPLGCIIADNIDNLLMTGGKASYSSLASSSAGEFDASIATGEAAGVVAVYSSYKNVLPSDISNDSKLVKELGQFLRRQGVSIPEIKSKDVNASSWVYSSVKNLRSLGLIAGGDENNYRYNKEATSQDLAMMLLNGVYRIDASQYTLEFDSRLRPFFTDDKLTKDIAGKILTALNSVEIDLPGAYEKACDLGYIDSKVKAKIESAKRDVLTLDEAYYLADFNIREYTGKMIE